MSDEISSAAGTNIADEVAAFYERHPYPLPVDDLEAYRRLWGDDRRRQADSHLFWPDEPYRDDRSILVAGCGTTQAAHYALRWPRAPVIGIDISAKSIAFTQGLKHKHALDNLEVRQLAVERAGELGRSFDHIVCSGVLHHLPDPDAGVRALRDALHPAGTINMMVYAPYGRMGVYMLQDYCRRFGHRRDRGGSPRSRREPQGAAVGPPNCPSPPQLTRFRQHRRAGRRVASSPGPLLLGSRIARVPAPGGLAFGRWVRQAPYLPWCGALASAPHHARLAAMTAEAQYAAVELFRGNMVRHAVVAHRNDRPAQGSAVDFSSERGAISSPFDFPIRSPFATGCRPEPSPC